MEFCVSRLIGVVVFECFYRVRDTLVVEAGGLLELCGGSVLYCFELDHAQADAGKILLVLVVFNWLFNTYSRHNGSTSRYREDWS
jgi:hypothetical protein